MSISPDQPAELEASSADPSSKDEVLSFKLTGRVLQLGGLEEEFGLMAEALKRPLTSTIAARVCSKSGTHLLKLVSPRADGDHACLRLDASRQNRRMSILPSTNAPDIPFCKVLYRPLEIEGFAAASVVDHIINPDDISGRVLEAFSSVFGADVLAEMKRVLCSPSANVEKLAAGEFPIIFVPHPNGGDLQITPVSPASSFMAIKRVKDGLFARAESSGQRALRGNWQRQAVSAKPQNISGAIGGPRLRFRADMPRLIHQLEAELFRYIKGGRFPKWRNENIGRLILNYADRLDEDRDYNNQRTRAALDGIARRLVRDAEEYIEETLSGAKELAALRDVSEKSFGAIPKITEVLLNVPLRQAGQASPHERARAALASAHFTDQLRKHHKPIEVKT